MRVVVVLVLGLAACGGRTSAQHDTVANHADPTPFAGSASPPYPTRLPPNPTREDFRKAVDDVEQELAGAQADLDESPADDEELRESLHARVERLSVERLVILRMRHQAFGDPCDPADSRCSP
jgi:hypothetical protein